MTPTVPVHDVILDEPMVDQLFFDIEHAAELIGIVQKGPGAKQSDPSPLALESAHRAFRAHELVALQLRYRFGGEEWWDTLMRTAGGVRLIRISHTRALGER